MTKLAVILLAAGQGTRMKSKTQKILHEVGGKPMVMHIFEAANTVADVPPVLVVGKGADGVQTLIGSRAQYAIQSEQMGTGHATMMAESLIKGQADQVIVTYGDMPLLKADTLSRLAKAQAKTGTPVVMLSIMGDFTSTFGRVVRDRNGYVTEIVEVAEARLRPNTQDLLAIRELNVGVYCFDGAWLWENIHKLPLRQARSGQEYYLTDMIELAVQQDRRVEAIVTNDVDESLGAGTRAELVTVERAFRARANRYWLDNGVTLIEPASTFIDQDVVIGQDTVIWPNTYLQGATTIGTDCVIGPNTMIRNTQIGNNCRLEQMVVENCELVDGTIGKPFQHLSGQ